MKRHHFNFLSFLFVIGLMVAGVLATYVATTGTGGFMTRAQSQTKTVCEKATYLGEKFCNSKKNLCRWRKNLTIATKGTCVSKVNDISKDNISTCGRVGAVCCTNATTGQGYCDSAKQLKCNPTSYTCVESSQNNLGQERGEKGTCSLKFKGASCMWRSSCAKQTPIGIPTPGYCKGPMEWQCCVPAK